MFALWKAIIYWVISAWWASNKLWWLLLKHYLGVLCYSVSLEWGNWSFCHFNSFVNVFMNAINTSFTLLCFWIPLGCGLCQFFSPRRLPASHNISLSCVAEHWQTQFTQGKSELAPCCGRGPDGNERFISFQGRTHLLWETYLCTWVWATRRKEELTQRKITAGQDKLRTQALQGKAS